MNLSLMNAWQIALAAVVFVGCSVPVLARLRRFPLAAGAAWFLAATVLSLVVLFMPRVSATRTGGTRARATQGGRTVGDDWGNPPRSLPGTPAVATRKAYVGSDSCRACHPREHATWHATYHRTMTQLATPDTVLGPFDTELELEGRAFRLTRDGDEFHAELPDPDLEWERMNERSDASRRQAPIVRRRVVMLTGSHRLQHYWVASADGQGLFSLPWEYQISEQRWIPQLDAHVIPPDQKRTIGQWNRQCIACHSVAGMPGLNPANGRFTTAVSELGIACESCHGPAANHEAHHRNPLNRYSRRQSEAPDPTIFNPARASVKESAEACGQCHSTFHLHDENAYMANGDDFHPGQRELNSRARLLSSVETGQTLARSRMFYWNANDASAAFWRDGAPRVGGREFLGLIATPCHDRGEMTCLTCHSMHGADPDQQLKPLARGNDVCLDCHASIGQQLAEHTHHRPDSSGSQCQNCHMPHTSFALMRATRSHRIDNPSVERSSHTGRPLACNLCHLDQTLAWSAEYLRQWYDQPVPSLTEDETRIAASLLWLLRGDAAQRVVTAWHFGWDEARRASQPGDWPTPHLAALLEDPYALVRFVAGKSLERQSDYSAGAIDYLAPAAARAALRARVEANWNQRARGVAAAQLPALLLQPDGQLDTERRDQLSSRRDDSPVKILE